LGERPQLDQAWCVPAHGLVHGRRLIRRESRIRRRLREHMIDGREYGRYRAEGIEKLWRDEFELRFVIFLRETPPHLVELMRRGALEREDRLLVVADGEHRPVDAPCAFAGGEFGHEIRHDLPLPRAG